jgi:hypothetical protein
MEITKLVEKLYQYTSKLDSLFKAYSGIFFLPETKLGLAILLLTLWDINIGLYLRIKPHAPPLVRVPVYSFEF